MNDLHTLQVNNVAIMGGGTQVKLVITFENDEQAVFKPMRYFPSYRILCKNVRHLQSAEGLMESLKISFTFILNEKILVKQLSEF